MTDTDSTGTCGEGLVVDGLAAGIAHLGTAGGASQEILRGIDLEVHRGEVHAVMGPNGSGKSTLSHVLLGHPGYIVTGGRVSLDGADVLAMATWQRAQAGLFLAMQYPIEVPGVTMEAMIAESLAAADSLAEAGTRPALARRQPLASALEAEALRVGFDLRFLARGLNVDLSGGERKRSEVVQMAVLQPRYAILDEIDSGLDVDALRAVARRVSQAASDGRVGVLAITHYSRLLSELRPDRVHVLSRGRIVRSGGPELAEELERTGYAEWSGEEPAGKSPSAPAR
jgi:Fe-S cluster assembly ATP-binding protein